MMSVAGTIDWLGNIEAYPSEGIDAHKAHSSGKHWRWLVHSQEFHDIMPRTLAEHNNRRFNEVSPEEHFLICDWLVKNGYADDDIFN